MTLPPGARLGPYEILAGIGAGGMGEVYRARDSRLGRAVAIKILPQHLVDSPVRRQRFEREARAASRLSHPHISAVYDIGEHDQILFIVMELLEGQTLAQRLRRGPLPLTEVLRHGIDIADALHHAHRAGIVHRDFKPANVMLTQSGAKLLDFGVAGLTESDAGDGTEASQITETESLTEAGTILGTLNYMAPEQLEGRETDARTDVFALGTVVYEMATARHAFDGTSKASLIAAILERQPPPMSSVAAAAEPGSHSDGLFPPALDHIVARCLAKDPDERWQTAADVRQELKWVADGLAQPSVSVLRVAPRRRLPLRVAWLAGACLAGAAVAYLAALSGWIGAQPEKAAFTQLTFGRGLITEARFTSDGQTILYSAAWNGGPVQLYMRSLGPESRSLPPSMAGLASVSSLNELALLLGCRLEYGFCVGTLARMPLSGGAPRELQKDVVSADWTPNGLQLAAIRETDGEYRIEFPVGEKTLYRTKGRLNSLRFAPSGDRLAFMEFPTLEEETGDLKLIDLEGRISPISTGWKTIRGLQWSLDGREIWFTGNRRSKMCSLYAVSLSGEVRWIFSAPGDVTLADVGRDGRLLLIYGAVRARMIWSRDAQERDLSWFDWSTVADLSADGNTLLFHEWGEGAEGTPALYTRRVDGSDAVKLGEGKALALSPDGRWALALVDKDRPLLTLVATATAERRALPTEGITDVYWARWFPGDARRVLLAASGVGGPQSYVLDVEGGGLQRIADIGTLGVLVAPDRQRILALDPLDGYAIWPLDGGDPVPVRGLGPEDRPFQWSSDGRFLYVRRTEDDVIRIDRYTMATGRRDLWRTLAPQDPAGLIGVATGRGELVMTPDGRSAAFTYWAAMSDLFLVTGAR